MPYIKKHERDMFNDEIHQLAVKIKDYVKDDLRMTRPGCMNYCITKLLIEVYGKDLRYADYNEIHGMLNCAALEFYCTRTRKYEEICISKNGDLD